MTPIDLLEQLWRSGSDVGRELGAFLASLVYPAGEFRHVLEVISDILSLFAAVGTGVFALGYRAFFNWRKTPAGRALSQVSLALTAVLILVFLARFIGQEYPLRWPLRIAVYGWLTYSVWRLVTELFRNWKAGTERLIEIELKNPKKEKTTMNTILTRAWWKAAGLRALRTAAALAVPYLGGSILGAVPWLTIVSAAGLGALLSLLTSLAGIPTTNGAPLWVSLLEKAAKTFGQALIAGIGNALLFQDVDWSVILQTAALAAFATILMQVVGTIPDVNPNPVPVSVEAAVTLPVTAADGVDAGALAASSIEQLHGPRPPTWNGTPSD